MRVQSVVICTLAALTSADLTGEVLAATPNTPSSTSDATNFIVPVQRTIPPTIAPVIAQPETQITPQFSPTAAPTLPSDLVVIATDVQVVGVTEELEQIVRKTIRTRTGGETSATQIQNDVAAILGTGLFVNASATSYSNPNGLKVLYQVQPVVVRSLELAGAQVLTPAIASDLFKAQLNAPVNPAALRQGIKDLNKWYADNGYVLAEVLDVKTTRDGVLKIDVAEGIVGDVKIRFLDKDGKATEGRTQLDFLNSELKLKPGQIFRVDVARGDLQHLYQLGLFEKADISLNGDARKIDVSYDLIEKPSRGVNLGGGYSDATGLYATVNYQDQNFAGINQQLSLNAQGNFRDLQFNGKFSSPYLASTDRLGYSISGFRSRDLSPTFDQNVKLPNGDPIREGRFGGSVTLTKPVGEWQGSLGLNYTRVSIRNANGDLSPVDQFGNRLSFSGTGLDDLVTVSAGITQDRRNNPINPTQGSVLSFTSEQSIPIGVGNILMNRLQANYIQYVPLNILGSKDGEVFAFNMQVGTTIGDLPPYQAFNLGGPNSVRGYEPGAVGSGRSYVLASGEYRFPIISPVGGVLFADFGSDLGTGNTVLGQPGIVRGKPGTGFGYGAGLRVDSPIGLIRADYGINDRGDTRLQIGIGQRF